MAENKTKVILDVNGLIRNIEEQRKTAQQESVSLSDVSNSFIFDGDDTLTESVGLIGSTDKLAMKPPNFDRVEIKTNNLKQNRPRIDLYFSIPTSVVKQTNIKKILIEKACVTSYLAVKLNYYSYYNPQRYRSVDYMTMKDRQSHIGMVSETKRTFSLIRTVGTVTISDFMKDVKNTQDVRSAQVSVQDVNTIYMKFSDYNVYYNEGYEYFLYAVDDSGRRVKASESIKVWCKDYKPAEPIQNVRVRLNYNKTSIRSDIQMSPRTRYVHVYRKGEKGEYFKKIASRYNSNNYHSVYDRITTIPTEKYTYRYICEDFFGKLSQPVEAVFMPSNTIKKIANKVGFDLSIEPSHDGNVINIYPTEEDVLCYEIKRQVYDDNMHVLYSYYKEQAQPRYLYKRNYTAEKGFTNERLPTGQFQFFVEKNLQPTFYIDEQYASPTDIFNNSTDYLTMRNTHRQRVAQSIYQNLASYTPLRIVDAVRNYLNAESLLQRLKRYPIDLWYNDKYTISEQSSGLIRYTCYAEHVTENKLKSWVSSEQLQRGVYEYKYRPYEGIVINYNNIGSSYISDTDRDLIKRIHYDQLNSYKSQDWSYINYDIGYYRAYSYMVTPVYKTGAKGAPKVKTVAAFPKTDVLPPSRLRMNVIRPNPYRIELHWQFRNFTLTKLSTDTNRQSFFKAAAAINYINIVDDSFKMKFIIARREYGSNVWKYFDSKSETEEVDGVSHYHIYDEIACKDPIDPESSMSSADMYKLSTQQSTDGRNNSTNYYTLEENEAMDTTEATRLEDKSPTYPDFMKSGLIYFYKVKAIDPFGRESEWSEELEVVSYSTIKPVKECTVLDLSEKVLPRETLITWTTYPDSAPPDHWIIERKIGGNGVWEQIGRSYRFKEHRVLFDDPAKMYENAKYRVIPVDIYGNTYGAIEAKRSE